MAKSDDILTAMVTMRLREDAAAAYRGKSPAERREIMQQLRDRLDEILGFVAADTVTQTRDDYVAIKTVTSEELLRDHPPGNPSPKRRPPIPND